MCEELFFKRLSVLTFASAIFWSFFGQFQASTSFLLCAIFFQLKSMERKESETVTTHITVNHPLDSKKSGEEIGDIIKKAMQRNGAI